ncbi:MAG: topology modulation protein [Candidatus Taylorbacteria bacterium]|nr:topology modulation protein [Candidatus Taylorbacteria bacterium]
MKRILIIGRSGAGKTTFAGKLGKVLNRDVIHLDNIFWKPGWVRAFTSDEWQKKINDLTEKEEWILDGNYHNTLAMRLQRADTVIFFDFNPFRTLVNACMRKHLPPKESGDTVERLHSEVGFFKLVKSIFKFPTRKVREQIEKTAGKDVFVIKNRREAEQTLQKLAMNPE